MNKTNTPFDNVTSSVSSSSIISSTPIRNSASNTSLATRPLPATIPVTTKNVTTVDASSSSDDDVSVDNLSSEEETEVVSKPNHDQTSIFNGNGDVQMLLDQQDNTDMNHLSTKFNKLKIRCERLEKELSDLRTKHTQLQQNTMRS